MCVELCGRPVELQKMHDKEEIRNHVVQFVSNPLVRKCLEIDGGNPLPIGLGEMMPTPKGDLMRPLVLGAHGVLHGQKLEIQERWWVGCMSPALRKC